MTESVTLFAISGSPPDAAAAMRAAAALELTLPSAPVTAAMNRFLSSSDIFIDKREAGNRGFGGTRLFEEETSAFGQCVTW